MFAMGTCFDPSPWQHAPRVREERRKVGEVPIIFQTTLILEVIKYYHVQREAGLPWMCGPEVFLWWLRWAFIADAKSDSVL